MNIISVGEYDAFAEQMVEAGWVHIRLMPCFIKQMADHTWVYDPMNGCLARVQDGASALRYVGNYLSVPDGDPVAAYNADPTAPYIS